MPTLEQLARSGEFRPIDLHLGGLLERLGDTVPGIGVIGALISRASGQGHVCLPLTDLEREADALGFELSAVKPLMSTLAASPMVGPPGSTAPLILSRCKRLYLHRFFRDEAFVAEQLIQRAAQAGVADPLTIQALLGQLWPANPEIDWQRVAVAMAACKRLSIITGGPGTGKTYVAARIIALALAVDPACRIDLAAPTGKAAARLQESMQQAAGELPVKLIPDAHLQAQTLHRLLNFRPEQSLYFRNRQNPLDCDLLIVDEASMIDLPLMAALTEALPPTCRLVLLGDRNQLASVEAGSLFADLCRQSQDHWSAGHSALISQCTGYSIPCSDDQPSMADTVCTLQRSRRFSSDSGIGNLASAVNSGDLHRIDSILSADHPQLTLLQDGLRSQAVTASIVDGLKAVFTAKTAPEAMASLSGFRILCAQRQGESGVAGLNQLAEGILRQAGLIRMMGPWFAGKPLMIARNDYDLGLFNGDIGICWPDDEGIIKVWFIDGNGDLLGISPSRLPDHDTAFAVTVHKAQGSEFDQVLLVLPENDSPLLTRELLYTGVTRARHRLILHGSAVRIHQAASRPTIRHSGLADRLYPPIPAESAQGDPT